MFVVQPIRYRHKLLVPPAFARFVPADQQNCRAPRVEGEQHTVGPSSVLNAQFLHVGVLRGGYRVYMRPAQRRAETSKQVYLSPYVHLFGFAQTFPPRSKFICKLYFPFLQRNIPPKAFSVKGTRRLVVSWGNPSSIRLAPSRDFNCSAESSISKLARLSWSGDTFRAPMIGITGTVWYRSHASATCAMLRPTCSETAFTAEMIRVACCSSGRNSFIPSLLIRPPSALPSP